MHFLCVLCTVPLVPSDFVHRFFDRRGGKLVKPRTVRALYCTSILLHISILFDFLTNWYLHLLSSSNIYQLSHLERNCVRRDLNSIWSIGLNLL